ncbi:4,4'-diaponeurosporenoate glycosyltransferase [Pirellulimonas nuda]|uniref:4,4'-diaponeurosporenoate glycosyltransferase n=1 Tax=Pirellulimonas nuda TaxID=2528009 RepID=A0A518DGL7_9BACT|nr:glycosyltransferase family 2 protein [Pirellulimonas nuda]QDU90618.1 4,4'-diaponeurosporenoate glycosyltransferase [Pirellulimonas nuda]
MTALAWCSLALALIPAWFYCRNTPIFRVPPPIDPQAPPIALSVLIPARDEAANIGDCLLAVLASTGVDLEAVVLDDHSTDQTAAIVRQMASADRRVRLIVPPQLPAGWNGKQHACWRLTQEAAHDEWVFLDADVRVTPDAFARAAAERRARAIDLFGGFPHQQTGTLLEKLLIPLIPFVLLGYLSLRQMRRSYGLGWAAGCGQFFVTHRHAYAASGGHAAIRASRHDGVMLPRAYRRARLRSDVFDASPLATCRMYDGARAVWQGLAKNAVEGAAAPRTIVPVTLLLVVGQVLPLPGMAAALAWGDWPAAGLFGAAWLLGLGVRLHAARRFRQDLLGAWLHPLGVAVLMALQWFALGAWLVGSQPAWRGRPATA